LDPQILLFTTGVPNLDELLGGGLPANTLNIVAGEPGTGKTIFAQQMMFHHVKQHSDQRVLYLTTLSEPAMKVIRYLQAFSFYDADAFGSKVVYRDVGGYLREHPPNELLEEIMRLVEEVQPTLLCIDSFKAIRDLMPGQDPFRRFSYDLSVRLASAGCTTLLLGEYEDTDVASGAEFAVADGIIQFRRGSAYGEVIRLISVKKLRGQPMNMGEFPFAISAEGIRVVTPTLTLRRMRSATIGGSDVVPTGISGLDDLLLGGIPPGRSIVISGVSGSGKTTLGLQFIVEGARRGEKGVLYSFEETTDRIVSLASGFGWDLQKYLDDGLVRLVNIPVTSIRVDQDLEDMIEAVDKERPKRIVIDSFSLFLHKVEKASAQREIAFQLASLVQRAGATALLLSDMPSREGTKSSRAAVEETVADGSIFLTMELRGGKRIRNIEVYKMRATDHVRGQHRMDITDDGIRVYYHAAQPNADREKLPAITFSPVDDLVSGEIPYDHMWLVRGGPGLGKSVWALQFAVERLRSGESVLFVTTDSSAKTVLSGLERLGVLTDPYVESGMLVVRSVDDHPELDLEDPESFSTTMSDWLDKMPKPCARILDSLTPLMMGLPPEQFKVFLTRRRQLVNRANVAAFDTVMASSDTLQPYLTNHYDMVVDLYTPDWGDLRMAGDSDKPVMRMVKARGLKVDTRPYPYRVRSEGGVVVQKEFYRPQSGGG